MKRKLDRLEECVLPLVAKPSRFLPPPGLTDTAGFGDAGGRVCLLLPESWERAWSHPGVLGLLEALTGASGGRLAIDLAFAPEPDLEARLRDGAFPLFGLGSRRSLAEFDAVIALLDHLGDAATGLRMLDLAGIPRRAEDRKDTDPVILVAGAAALTPAPLAPFADAFLVGDPEAFVDDLCALLPGREGPEGGRRTVLFRLGETAGVHLPGSPDPVETRRSTGALCRGGPEWLPIAETEAGALVLEIGREGSNPDDPPRSLPEATAVVARGIEAVVASGVSDLLLAGAAGRHPALVSILEDLNRDLGLHGVSVRVSEVDFRLFEPGVARELAKAPRQELVFRAEAASARLRAERGRPLSDDALLEAIAIACRGAWRAIRFKVWLGLPGETAEDHAAWARILETAAAGRRRGPLSPRFILEVLPFCPRPHTGSEGAPTPDPARLAGVAESWAREFRRQKIRVDTVALERASLETALLRSGPEAAPVLELLAAPAASLPEVLGRLPGAAPGWTPVEPYPWAVVRKTAPAPEETLAGPGRETAAAAFGTPAWTPGRRPKRARGRDGRQADRFRLRFSKEDPLRFLSHLDVTRAFLRAFLRSQLPVAVSNGKDRRQKLSFGPPLPVGMTSGAEFLDLAFTREVPETFVRSLNPFLPEGLAVVACVPIRTEPASLNSAIQIADYEVSFPDCLIEDRLDGMAFDELKARLEARVDEAMASDHLSVTKVRGDDSRTFNARPSLKRIGVVPDDGGRPALSMTLTLNQPGSVRPELLTATLVNWAEIDERLLRVHRSGLHIPGRNKDLDPLEVVASGFKWWRQPVRGGTVL